MDPNNPPQPGGGWPPHNPHTPPPHGGQPQQPPYGGQAHSGGPYGNPGQAQHGYGPQGGYGPPGGGYGAPPAPPKKSNTKWWIFGCLGCGALIFVAFFVLGLGAWIAGLHQDANEREAASHADGVEGQAAAEELSEWVSAPERLHADLAPHFVPFTLRYPSSWEVMTDGSIAGDPNLFKVENRTEDGTTIENFSVGYFTGPGAAEGSPALLEGILSVLEGQLRGTFTGLERVSEETTKVDGRWAKGFRFRSYVVGDADTVPLFGRLLAAPTGGDNGAVLLMLATPHAPGITGPDDVGEKGGSALILRSIRFTGGTAPATDDAAAAPATGVAELATRAANAIREYDGNGDGWLSGTELTACECGGLDTDQDGRVTRDEVAAGFAASEEGN